MIQNQTSNRQPLVELHGDLPQSLAQMSLAQAYNLIVRDCPAEIPFVVWLLENPDSPLPLPGRIHLRQHDYLHLLLGRGFSASDEAYVIDLTMGNDLSTKRWHLWLYKFVSLLIYPPQFRFTLSDLREFDKGLALGRSLPIKNLNKLDFTNYQDWQIQELRIGGCDDSQKLDSAASSRWLVVGATKGRPLPVQILNEVRQSNEFRRRAIARHCLL